MRRTLLLIPLIFTTACLTDDDVNDRNDEITDVDGDGFASTDYGGDDCNDDDDDINPSIEETPYDGVDNDCDAETLDDDLDEDGFSLDQDCDDLDGSVNPLADEICDDIDNNCDDEIDEATAIDASTFYRDNDDDGYADESISTTSCNDELEGYLPAPTDDNWDCDDSNIDANPDMDETCLTEFDDDCDGTANVEDSLDCTNYFYDSDGDGFGIASLYSCLCLPDEGSDMTSLEGIDCDDTEFDTNPDAVEIIGDSVDSDCDESDDSFTFIDIDTRSSVDVYGPRMESDGDTISLAWIAEELTDSNGALYESQGLSTFDGSDLGAGETAFHSFGESSNIGTLGEAWDFAMTGDYWAYGFATRTSSGVRETTYLTVDSTTQQTGGMSLVSQDNLFDDLQMAITQDYNTYLTGCGLSTDFLVLGATLTDMAGGGSGSILWEPPFKNYTWIGNSWQFVGTSNNDYDTCELGDGNDRFYWKATNSNLLTYDQIELNNYSLARLNDYAMTGYDFWDMEFTRHNNQDLWGRLYGYDGTYYIYLYGDSYTSQVISQKGVDIDVTNSPGGYSLACVVYEDGSLELFYTDDVDSGLAPSSVVVDPGLSGPIDECAVTVTENSSTATLAIAARSGDEIKLGFAYID